MRKLASAAVFTVLSGAMAPDAAAIPAFARRYGADCSYCHQVFPKLSYEGQRFKERGFRMASEDAFDADAWISSVPVVVRGWWNHLLLEDLDDSDTGFFKGVTAGNLGKRLSYWVDDAVLVTEGDDTLRHVKPSNVWARFELIANERLYVKAGRFELDLPFTQVRTPHLFSYDIYFTASGEERDNIGSYQEGGELGGAIDENWRWSAALVKGRNSAFAEALTDEAGKFDSNLFLRLRNRTDQNRFGAFAYIGRNTLALTRSVVFKNNLQRYGVDVDFWISKLNLYGVYLHGRDSNPFATSAQPQGTREPQTFDGGFAQADWHARHNLVLSARLNLEHRPRGPAGAQKETFAGLFPGIQLWLFKHAKLSFEYGFRNQQRRSFGAVQAELAF